MPLPDDFYDDDRNYRIRLCMTIFEARPGAVVEGSKVRQCDRCGALIWVNESQEIPNADIKIDGDVCVCFPCVKAIQERAGVTPQWLGPTPQEYGIPDPFDRP